MNVLKNFNKACGCSVIIIGFKIIMGLSQELLCMNNEEMHLLSSQVLSKKKLQDLVREIDPNEQLDEDVEEVCLWF